jgi:hypothetical protein
LILHIKTHSLPPNDQHSNRDGNEPSGPSREPIFWAEPSQGSARVGSSSKVSGSARSWLGSLARGMLVTYILNIWGRKLLQNRCNRLWTVQNVCYKYSKSQRAEPRAGRASQPLGQLGSRHILLGSARLGSARSWCSPSLLGSLPSLVTFIITSFSYNLFNFHSSWFKPFEHKKQFLDFTPTWIS